MACIGVGISKISTNHLWNPVDRKLWIYQRLEGLSYNLFDAIVAVSEPVEHEVRAFLVKEKKLSIISNGIDCEYFTVNSGGEPVRSALGISGNDFVLGVVGRFSKQKGHQYMVQALQPLVLQHPRLKCVFWGAGELEEEVRRQVSAYGLEQSVVFAGVSKDMPAVYAAVDLLVLPSLSEGLPMTMLEAMAAGVPVLATSVGDIPKVVEDEKSGFLVEAENTVALVRKILTVFENRTRLSEVAAYGQQIVQAQYSAVKMANEYKKIYEQILK